MNDIEFAVRGEYITLDALLKAAGLADSGGAAKTLIAQGQVSVDGQIELRKTRKVRAGQQVLFAGTRLRLVKSAPDGDEAGNLSTTVRL